MNTTAQNRRAAAFAAVVLALALPLAACQTPVGSADVPVAPAQLKLEKAQPPADDVAPVPSPSAIPVPTPAPAAPAGKSPRAKCIAEHIAQGFEPTRVAPALCAGGVRAY